MSLRHLNKAVETVDEMQAFNLMSEHIDSDIKDLYKIALQREQDRKQNRLSSYTVI